MSPAAGRVKAYLLFQGRSGSGLLLSLLRTSPAIHFEDEWLLIEHRESSHGPTRQPVIVHRLFSEPRPDGVTCVGFVSKLRDIAWPVGLADALEAHDARVIDLRRRNLAKQALSSINLERTRRVTGRSHAWSERDVSHEPFEVDLDRFDRLLRLYHRREQEQGRFAVSRPWSRIEVHYEDLVVDRAGTMRRVARFLDVDPGSLNLDPDRIPLKQTPPRLASMVVNLDALRDRYQGTRVAAMLDDPGV